MLDAKRIEKLRESEAMGEKLANEYKELERIIEEGSMKGIELLYKFCKLNTRYNLWKANHDRLLMEGYLKNETNIEE